MFKVKSILYFLYINLNWKRVMLSTDWDRAIDLGNKAKMGWNSLKIRHSEDISRLMIVS